MSEDRIMRWMGWALAAVAVILGSCAAFPRLDPPRVSFSGVEDVGFEGMEMRMLLKLRVQNPNSLAIDYDGIDVTLSLEGKGVAHGVSAERGSIPGYGEAVVTLPVTVSLLDLGRQAMRIFGGGSSPPRLRYSLEGKLGSPLFGATRFHSEGELRLPGAADQGLSGGYSREYTGAARNAFGS